MKITFVLFSILLSLSSCASHSSEGKSIEMQPETLKVLSWNVWHAGHSKEYPEKGCEGTMGILKKSEADLILMIETYGCSNQIADHL